MKLNEFKAWLDGYSEAIDEYPTKSQWEKILAKVQDIEPEVVTKVEYVTSPLMNDGLKKTLPTWDTPFCSKGIKS